MEPFGLYGLKRQTALNSCVRIDGLIPYEITQWKIDKRKEQEKGG